MPASYSTTRRFPPSAWAGIFLLTLGILLAVTLAPYRGNVSALFHLDASFSELHPVSPNVVVLTIPGYDGMQYFQIARNVPALSTPSQWGTLAAATAPGFYAYQRILLPVLAYAVSLGQNGALPFAFLAINVLSLLGTFFLILRWKRGSPLLAFALALCPAATVGLHFSLAEPLNLLLVTAFLLVYIRRESVDPAGAALLSLAVLTREINIFLAFGVFLLSCWKGQWRSALLCIIPAVIFWLLQGYLFLIFGEVPFLMSTAKHAFPLLAPVHLLTGFHGYGVKPLSSLALLLLFVLPATILTATDALKGRADRLTLLLLLFLGTQLLGLSLVSKAIVPLVAENGTITVAVPETPLGPPPETTPWGALLLIGSGVYQ